MKKKLLIALGIAALLPLSTHAQEVMVVYSHSGQHLLESDVESISSLTPSDDVLNVKSRLGKVSAISLSDIRSIKFIPATTAIGKLRSADGKLSFANNGDQITVSGWNGKEGHFAVYSADGSLVISGSRWTGTPISTTQLTPGLYILKVNNQSFKFIK